MIYLDYNATAPLMEAAKTAMVEAMSVFGNPSSVHGFGRNARKAIEASRKAIAAQLGVPASWLIFTSGGTEASALALQGTQVDVLYVGAVEHDAVLANAKLAKKDVRLIPVDANGIIDLVWLGDELKNQTQKFLVSVMLANNETGVIQPIRAIADLVRAHGGFFHCDAVQALGKMPVDMQALGPDMISISAHKIGGPKGIGALVAPEYVPLAGIIAGGGQERRQRSGTENTLGIIGFGAAAEALPETIKAYQKTKELRDYFENEILACEPKVQVFGAKVDRLPNTSCLTMPGVSAQTQLMALDVEGVMVSSGSACSSGSVKKSHVLDAMGVDDATAKSAIRISLGPDSTKKEINRLIETWKTLYERTYQLQELRA